MKNSDVMILEGEGESSSDEDESEEGDADDKIGTPSGWLILRKRRTRLRFRRSRRLKKWNQTWNRTHKTEEMIT